MLSKQKPRNLVAKDLMSAKYRMRKADSKVKVYSRSAQKQQTQRFYAI
jgi:hypothetical protein